MASIFSYLIILVTCCASIAKCVEVHETSTSINEGVKESKLTSDIYHDKKLDRIFESLEQLSNKFDLLNLSVQKHCGCKRVKSSAQVPSVALALTSNGNNDTNPRAKTSLEDNKSKDLFHLNKLAPNLNSIATEWSEESQDEDREDTDFITADSWFTGISNQNQAGGTPSIGSKSHKRFMLTLSQQYESMFGAALDNLSTMTREQLASFRLTLNKLMSRFLDQTYQYNSISNQISLVKEECSLAASLQNNLVDGLASLIASKSKAQPSGQPASEEVTAPQPPPQQQHPPSALRSSEISMIARLLSGELSELVKSMLTGSSLTTSKMVNRESQLDGEGGVQSYIGREIRLLTGRLDEISSVVKQSALFLTKLTEMKSKQPMQGDGFEGPSTVEINFNNRNETDDHDSAQSKQPQTSTGTRWFSGSKIPGRNRTLDLSNQNNSNSNKQQPTIRQSCQSKTNLVTPASCRQLRLAGANCTGQYYVFVKGSIRHVYCDMNMDPEDDGGGWTVILRRIDKSFNNYTKSSSLLEQIKASQVNFHLDWANYKLGFGQLNDWAEFFIGLDLLHQLTSVGETLASNSVGINQTEMQIDLTFANSSSKLDSDLEQLHLKFDHFKVHDEQSLFRLEVGQCNATLGETNSNGASDLCSPLSSLNGSRFETYDRQSCNATNRGPETTGGWWSMDSNCGDTRESIFSLTQAIGRLPSGQVEHLYWPAPEAKGKAVKKLVVKIRRKRAPGSSLWLSV